MIPSGPKQILLLPPDQQLHWRAAMRKEMAAPTNSRGSHLLAMVAVTYTAQNPPSTVAQSKGDHYLTE